MDMTAYVAVAGTNSWADIPIRRMGAAPLWWQASSPFSKYLLEQHWLRPLNAAYPFIWNTNLSGVFWKPGQRDWKAAGANLWQYFDLQNAPFDSRNIIAHSHGLQVVMYACAYGLSIRNLITVGGPIRHDMADVSAVARTRIVNWLHIYDSDDRTQILGELGDGAIDAQHAHPLANVNQAVPGISHSNILYLSAYFHLWVDNQWPTWLRLSPTIQGDTKSARH